MKNITCFMENISKMWMTHNDKFKILLIDKVMPTDLHAFALNNETY